MSKRFWSADEACLLLGCSAENLRRLVRRGEVPAERAGRTYVFDATAIEIARSLVTGKRRRRENYVQLVDFDPVLYLDPRETAVLLALTERQVWRLITDGHLQGHRWKGLVLVERSQAVALQEARIARQRVVAARGRRPGQDAEAANQEKH